MMNHAAAAEFLTRVAQKLRMGTATGAHMDAAWLMVETARGVDGVSVRDLELLQRVQAWRRERYGSWSEYLPFLPVPAEVLQAEPEEVT